jgi:hypothetical protein
MAQLMAGLCGLARSERSLMSSSGEHRDAARTHKTAKPDSPTESLASATLRATVFSAVAALPPLTGPRPALRTAPCHDEKPGGQLSHILLEWL